MALLGKEPVMIVRKCEDTLLLSVVLLLCRNQTFSTFSAAESRNGNPNRQDRFGGLGMLAHENIAPVSTPRKTPISGTKSELDASLGAWSRAGASVWYVWRRGGQA